MATQTTVDSSHTPTIHTHWCFKFLLFVFLPFELYCSSNLCDFLNFFLLCRSQLKILIILTGSYSIYNILNITDRSEDLMSFFEKAEILKHGGGHYVPSSKEQKEPYLKFFTEMHSLKEQLKIQS